MYKVKYIPNLEYYGSIENSQRIIEINDSVIAPRKMAALFHEALHAMDEKLGLKIPHDMVVAIATWMINLYPKLFKLAGSRWSIKWDTYPVKIVKDPAGMPIEKVIAEMVEYISAFNKWHLPSPAIDWIVRNLLTFYEFPQSLKEDGAWE